MKIEPRPLSTLDTIRYHGWLNYISDELRQAVLDRCPVRSAAAGDIVFRIHDPSDGVYGVVSGAFAFEVAPAERGPQLVHTFTAGTWVGEAEIFTNRARLGTLVALRSSEYLHLPMALIEQLATEGINIWRGLGALAGLYVELALTAIDDLTIRPPKERVAAILLRLAGARLSDVPDDPTPTVRITQADLAKIANTSRSTIVRVLAEFDANGCIENRYGNVKLVDCRALREMLADA
jgi:CRP-like cAMP-binding protein